MARKYEIVPRVLHVEDSSPSQLIEADYVQYERGDAVFYSGADPIPDKIAPKCRIVAIAPRESFSLVKEVKD